MAFPLWTMIGKLREFKRNEKLSREQFDAMKLAKFRKLAVHANQHSPYYAQIIKERGIDIAACTPFDFPVLTKSLLMANFDQIVTDRRITKQRLAEFLTHSTEPNDLYLDEFQVVHTSGSSGEVGYFVYSQTDWASGGVQSLRRRAAQNATPRKKRKSSGRFRAVFYGAIGGHYGGVSGASMAKRGMAKLFVNMQLYEVNSPLPEVIEQLNAFQPESILGYTAALKMLAGKQKEGVLRISPIAVGTTGEAMSPGDKSILEDAFGCDATSMYGCTEHLMMGLSTPGGKSMVLYDDDLIYELFDDHSLVTNLFNTTLPLIRYRMSDILRPVANSKLTTPYIEIESLVGRAEMMPMFVNRDGAEDFISPHTINELFVAGVTRFQMHLLSKASFRFMVCLDSQLNLEQTATAMTGMERRLREVLDQKLMNNVTFEVVATDDLPVNPKTRKFNLIVDARATS